MPETYNERFVITRKDRRDLQEHLDIARSVDQIEARKFSSLGKKGKKYYIQFAKFDIQ